MAQPAWWQTRAVALLAILAAAVPLLWLAVAPLTDAPGHIGRYRIVAEADGGDLGQYYGVRWALIGNLGVDLLVLALYPLLDVEQAARLVITLIPVATVAAMLWLAREAHGRLPATAMFALPLAYSYPFQLGFVNFCLAAAMALAGLALWIRLARTSPTWVRIAMFVPLAGLVWLCHSFGWAMLGLFILGAEWQFRMTKGVPWRRAAIVAGLMALPMAYPVAFLLLGDRDSMAGDTGDWFHWSAKAQWLVSLLRERWKIWDVACVILLVCLLWTAIRSKRMSFAPILAIPALLGFAAFILLPRLFQGGAGVDMRILPFAAILGLLAIRSDQAIERRLAAAAAAFFAVRIATTTAAFALFAQGQQQELRALAALPRGAAVLVLVDEPTTEFWFNPRLSHVAGLAIARKRVFTNEQWALAGQQLIRPLNPAAAPLDRDPSQIVHPPSSRDQSTDFDAAIAAFDRCAFQRVWTIGFPPGRARAADLWPVWSDGRSTVYAVDRAQCLSSGAHRR